MTLGPQNILGNLTRKAVQRIADSGSDSAKFDVELLIEFAFGFNRSEQIINRAKHLTDIEVKAFEGIVERRINKEPVAYIIGEQEFWSLPFKVNKYTLIPRPDTETLIEVVVKRLNANDAAIKFLDIGTGSGCILLSILSEYKEATGIGADISKGALETASANAEALGFAGRAEFIPFDILGDVSPLNGRMFSCVVSNPPYIPDGDVNDLMIDVQDYEPLSALKGGADGLVFYRAILSKIPKILRKGGLLAFEVGIGQADDTAALMQQNAFQDIEIKTDLAGIPRVVSGYFNN